MISSRVEVVVAVAYRCILETFGVEYVQSGFLSGVDEGISV